MFLFINTAFRQHEVILIDYGNVLFDRNFVGGRNGEEPFYKSLIELKERFPNLQNDLEFLVTLTGPGSFTALRLGVSSANAFGLAWGKKVLGIPTYDFVKIGEENLPVVLPGGGHFVHLFEGDSHKLIDIDELDKSCKYLGEVSEKFSRDIQLVEMKGSKDKLNLLDFSKYEKKIQVFPFYAKDVV